MGNIGWSGIIIVVVLVVLLFGRGKISSIMGDVAKGIKSFRKGISSDEKGMSSDEVDQPKSTPTEENSSEDSNSEKK